MSKGRRAPAKRRKKISTRDYLVCFRKVREQGIQGEQLIDAISACVRKVYEGAEKE